MVTAKLEKGALQVHVGDLLSSLTGDDRRALVEMLACEDSLFKEVVNQLLTGYTSDGSSTYQGTLKEARKNLLAHTGHLLHAAITDVARDRDWAQERGLALEKELRMVRDAWPRDHNDVLLPQGKLRLHAFTEECDKECAGKSYEHGPSGPCGPPYNVKHEWAGASMTAREAEVAAILARAQDEREIPGTPDVARAYYLGRRVAALTLDLRAHGAGSEQGKKLSAELEEALAEFESVRYA